MPILNDKDVPTDPDKAVLYLLEFLIRKYPKLVQGENQQELVYSLAFLKKAAEESSYSAEGCIRGSAGGT